MDVQGRNGEYKFGVVDGTFRAHIAFSNFLLEEGGSHSRLRNTLVGNMDCVAVRSPEGRPPESGTTKGAARRKGELGTKGHRVWFPGQKGLGIGRGVLFHVISVKVLSGKSLLFVCTAVLGIALTLIVGPFGCALLCADDCCSDDSSCPICLFTGVHGAPASAPVAIAVVTFSPIPIPLIAESEVHSADDHQLLPSRGPPAFLAV